MNVNQVNGILRAIVPAALAWAVAKDWVTQNTVTDVTAAVVTIGAAAWSIYTNSNKALVASVQTIPAAQVAVSDPDLLSPGVTLAPAHTIKNTK